MSKCRFYDDGHGNGEYISGSSCECPSCSLGGNESCDGNVSKFNVKSLRLLALADIVNKKIDTINQIKREIKNEKGKSSKTSR
jgi:hypothetical protein